MLLRFLIQKWRRRFYSKVSIFAQHCMRSLKTLNRVYQSIFRKLRLKVHFSQKDLSKENAEDTPPPLHNLEKQWYYRPKIIWAPAPGKCGTLESYVDAVKLAIEKLCTNQKSSLPVKRLGFAL